MVACKLLEEDQGSLEGLLGVAVRGLLEEVTANKHGYRGQQLVGEGAEGVEGQARQGAGSGAAWGDLPTTAVGVPFLAQKCRDSEPPCQ
jgi:hypothetical protein